MKTPPWPMAKPDARFKPVTKSLTLWNLPCSSGARMVRQSAPLGPRGGGYRQFLHTLTGGRIAIAALSVGVAQACLDAALAYAKERRTFGEPISKHQAIQFKLADMAMETEVARTIVYRAAAAYGHEGAQTTDEVRMLAAMSKLYASEASKRAADNAVQIHGGYGFMEDYPVARYWRDVKVNEIGEGNTANAVLLRNRDYQAKVGFGKLIFCLLVAALNGAREPDLFFGGEELRPACPTHPNLKALVVARVFAVFR